MALLLGPHEEAVMIPGIKFCYLVIWKIVTSNGKAILDGLLLFDRQLICSRFDLVAEIFKLRNAG